MPGTKLGSSTQLVKQCAGSSDSLLFLECVVYTIRPKHSTSKNIIKYSAQTFCHEDVHHRLPGGSVVKDLPAMQETWVQSLGWDDPLEKEIATHSSILA